MGITFHVSDYGQDLRDIGTFLLTDNEYLFFEEDSGHIVVADDWKDEGGEHIGESDSYSFYSFWQQAIIGLQMLLKGVLVKGRVDIFERDDRDGLYKTGTVAAPDDQWFQDILDSHGVERFMQLGVKSSEQLIDQHLEEFGRRFDVDLNDLQVVLRRLIVNRGKMHIELYYKNNVLNHEGDLTEDLTYAVNELEDLFELAEEEAG